jgi:hypothetical protein
MPHFNAILSGLIVQRTRFRLCLPTPTTLLGISIVYPMLMNTEVYGSRTMRLPASLMGLNWAKGSHEDKSRKILRGEGEGSALMTE